MKGKKAGKFVHRRYLLQCCNVWIFIVLKQAFPLLHFPLQLLRVFATVNDLLPVV
jgi:hypothetical protein